MRKRASSLLDKPGGTGATGRERGSAGADIGDGLRGSEAALPSGCSGSSRCCSTQEYGPCWVVSRGLGLNGVMVDCELRSTKGIKVFDLADLRLRTKTAAPITRRTAATLPTAAPAIAPVCDDAVGCSPLAPVAVPVAFIVKIGALKEGRLSDMEPSRDRFARTSGLMART